MQMWSVTEEEPEEVQALDSSTSGLGKGTKSCYEWMEAIIPALILIMVFFTFVIRSITVSGPSMIPTLEDQYKVWVSCIGYTPHQGDVVVVDGAGTALNEVIVKRVIATEGQTVDIDFMNGIVYVDGEPLDESAYIENGITRNQYDVEFPQTVPAGHVFVLGDNRPVSMDSRDSMVGMIDQRYIIGKVQLVYQPFSEFGRV